MIVRKLLLYETRLFHAIFPRLDRRVFHVSRLSNMGPILASGEIRPNSQGSFATTFGFSGNSFFRNRSCVSLFDLRSATPEERDASVGKCSPTKPASPESGIAIFMLSSSTYPRLLPWSLWKQEKAWKEMVVPYIEAGHPGPIPL